MDWVWRGNTLFDAAGNQLATVGSGGIATGEGDLRLRRGSSTRFFYSATMDSGEVFSVEQTGLSVGTLVGVCESRRYELRRDSPLRKQRLITSGAGLVARTRPQGDTLVVSQVASPELLDLVFLTWCCVLVDLPHRQMRV